MGSVNGCRARCSSSSSMAGWSMVADEEDAVDVSKTPKKLEPDKSLEKPTKELVSLFRLLLGSYLGELRSDDDSLLRAVDFFTLFINVSYKGGFDAVSENGSWDEIAQGSGFEFISNSVSVEQIYLKYLDAFARLLNGDTIGMEFSGDLVSRVKDFVSQVKRKYEVRKGKAAKEFGAELKWFISKTKRRYIGKETRGSKTPEKLIILEAGKQGFCSSPRKRKRECSLGTLRWLSEVAKDPSDPCIGRLPDRSMWESYGSEEPWKQLITFRDSRTNTDPSCQKTWQRIQKMHPSMYDDSTGTSYNLRERLSLNEKKAEKESGSASDSDEEDRPCPRVGSEFQAEVPEWTETTCEGDLKWLGAQVWPLSKELNNSNCLIERDPIGKGRQDSCGCQNPGSVECVRFHIKTKQEKLKLELGPAFYAWCVDIMGEGTLQYWTEYEQKTANALMTNPPTLSQSVFDQLKNVLGYKNRGKIVSYFYNVILLQFRAKQSRITPQEVDSDTDQLYFTATANEEANTSQKPLMLTPKRLRRR